MLMIVDVRRSLIILLKRLDGMWTGQTGIPEKREKKLNYQLKGEVSRIFVFITIALPSLAAAIVFFHHTN